MPNISLLTPDEVCSELGSRARARRLSLNIALEELAARIGVSDRTLRSFEKTGRCNLSTFVRVVEALGALSDLQPVLAAELRSINEMRQQVQSRQRQRTRRKPPSPVAVLT